LAEAAGSSRESGKNDIKPGKMQARPDGGPKSALGGEREGRGEGVRWRLRKKWGWRGFRNCCRNLRTFTDSLLFLIHKY
jgi:hypothetical protein